MKESNRSPKIPIHEFVDSKQSNLFNTFKYSKFTGELVFASLNGEEWIFHLYQGRVVYATGGKHPIRRWLRNVKKFSPHSIDQLSEIKSQLLSKENWQYDLLTYWLNNGIVSRQNFRKIICNMLREILFDVTQKKEIFFQLSEQQSLVNPLVFINPIQIISQASEIWRQWEEAKLSDISPNYSPTIVNIEGIKKFTSEMNDQNIFHLCSNGNTIRDLSINLNQDIVSITRSILPYVEKGFVQLISIPDLPCPIQFS